MNLMLYITDLIQRQIKSVRFIKSVYCFTEHTIFLMNTPELTLIKPIYNFVSFVGILSERRKMSSGQFQRAVGLHAR